jgi:hypothetical protein
VLVSRLHQLQRQIDLAQRAHHLGFVGFPELMRRQRNRAPHVGALDPDEIERRAPESGQQQQGEQGKQHERFGDPAQPSLQASSHELHDLWGGQSRI